MLDIVLLTPLNYLDYAIKNNNVYLDTSGTTEQGLNLTYIAKTYHKSSLVVVLFEEKTNQNW